MALRQFLPQFLRRRWEGAQHQVVMWKDMWGASMRPVSVSRHSPEELEARRLQYLRKQPSHITDRPPNTGDSAPPVQASKPPTSQKIPVYYRDEKVLLWLSEGETILEAGLRADLDMMFSCQMGGCAACKIKLLTGQVEMEEPNCLSEEEREEGYCLACVARPLTPVAVAY